MPRNTAAKPKSNVWASVLRFIASILFLYVIFGMGGALSPWISTGSAGAIWLPILFGVAVLSTIGLFFGSIGGIAMSGKSTSGMSWMGWKTMMAASFSLVALTVSPAWSAGFWIVILGFLIGWFGSALEMM